VGSSVGNEEEEIQVTRHPRRRHLRRHLHHLPLREAAVRFVLAVT